MLEKPWRQVEAAPNYGDFHKATKLKALFNGAAYVNVKSKHLLYVGVCLIFVGFRILNQPSIDENYFLRLRHLGSLL
jgi:hypothetical protein